MLLFCCFAFKSVMTCPENIWYCYFMSLGLFKNSLIVFSFILYKFVFCFHRCVQDRQLLVHMLNMVVFRMTDAFDIPDISEDCLYLNIYSLVTDDDVKLPVQSLFFSLIGLGNMDSIKYHNIFDQIPWQ